MHNISFDKSKHKVFLLRRVPTPNVHLSLAQFEERVIVSDVRKNPTTLVDATKAYANATSLSVRFFITENELVDKELQVAKQGGTCYSICESGDKESETG